MSSEEKEKRMDKLQSMICAATRWSQRHHVRKWSRELLRLVEEGQKKSSVRLCLFSFTTA